MEITQLAPHLPRGRTLFHYFQDRYALMLLEWALAQRPRRICDLKQTRWCHLLRKPTVRQALAGARGNVLRAEDVASVWPGRPHVYRLSADVWGLEKGWQQFWYQNSRPGLNLVLQLNFNSGHDHSLRELLGKGTHFSVPCHPVSQRWNTLAWSRIDLDWAMGEALIEEVQSDWVRQARWSWQLVQDFPAGGEREDFVSAVYGAGVRPEHVGRYVEEILAPHARVWDEAMLAATLWLLVAVLEIHTIWIHTPESGYLIKHMDGSPRSIYGRLPRRFGFLKTYEPPRFLRETPHRRVRKSLSWGPLWQVLRV